MVARSWIYPTYSDDYPLALPLDESRLTARQTRAINKQYLKQRFMDAFSSKDLVNWIRHERVLDIVDVSWAKRALWAPSVIEKDGWYYLFFGANDIQSDQELGGIGVARSRSPAGPFKDYLGRPLIDKFHNGAQPIDQMVFRDRDGAYYIVYGGWRHCNIARLNDDFTGFVPFADGTIFKEITPKGYVEGAYMMIVGTVLLHVVRGRMDWPRLRGGVCRGNITVWPVRAGCDHPQAGSRPGDRGRASLGAALARVGDVVHRLPSPPAGRDRSQLPRGEHRGAAIRCSGAHPPGGDHVRGSEGEAAERGSIGAGTRGCGLTKTRPGLQR